MILEISTFEHTVHCPYCARELSAAAVESVEGDFPLTPKVGDLGCCNHCHRIFRLGSNQSLLRLDQDRIFHEIGPETARRYRRVDVILRRLQAARMN